MVLHGAFNAFCTFIPFSIEPTTINEYINLIYENYLTKNYFEACSYALYYAAKYNLEIKKFNVSTIISKEDCILDLLSLIYCRKMNRSKALKILENYAEQLNLNNNFDSF